MDEKTVKTARELLEHLAFRMVADASLPGMDHGCRIARVPAGGWQAAILQDSGDVAVVRTPDELRRALADPAAAIVFLPGDVAMNDDALARICRDCTLPKAVIWER